MIFCFIGYYSELICIITFVHSILFEGTDEGRIFIRKVPDCPQYMVIDALGGVGIHMIFERNDGI